MPHSQNCLNHCCRLPFSIHFCIHHFTSRWLSDYFSIIYGFDTSFLFPSKLVSKIIRQWVVRWIQNLIHYMLMNIWIKISKHVNWHIFSINCLRVFCLFCPYTGNSIFRLFCPLVVNELISALNRTTRGQNCAQLKIPGRVLNIHKLIINIWK